jgi:hypothetical protein
MMKRIMEELKEKLGKAFVSETVFGEPREFKSVTIIPVARLTHYGTGTYMEEEHAEEAGFKKSPMGYLEIRDDHVRFISLYDYTEFFALGALTGAGVCLLLSHLFSPPSSRKEEKPREQPGRKVLKILATTLGIGVLGYYLCKLLPSLPCHGDAMADIEEEILALGNGEKKSLQICLDPLEDGLEATWNSTEVVTIDEPIDSLLDDEQP